MARIAAGAPIERFGRYRALHERLAAALYRAAKDAGELDFASCDYFDEGRSVAQSTSSGDS
jgi:hypothetical protein